MELSLPEAKVLVSENSSYRSNCIDVRKLDFDYRSKGSVSQQFCGYFKECALALFSKVYSFDECNACVHARMVNFYLVSHGHVHGK